MNDISVQKTKGAGNSVRIRPAVDTDLDAVLSVERLAFGYDKEAELVRDLLDDPSARPVLSLLAFKQDRAVGHILFTAARLAGATDPVPLALLAPLAVVPDAQKQGIGGQLIEHGLKLLSGAGTGLVFVLGHAAYYPRFGFRPAGPCGFEAPYPIPDEHAEAWMVQALVPGLLGRLRGRVVCADALQRPEHWRE
jgi:putative acetyltransferase